MGWNPANWKITDTIQGQDGGFSFGGIADQIGNGLTGIATGTPTYSPKKKTAPVADQNTGVESKNSSLPASSPAAVLGSTNSSSVRGPVEPAYDPHELSLLNYQLDFAKDGLGRLDGQRAIGNSNINSSYNSALGRILSQSALADRNYNSTKEETAQDFGESRASVRAGAGNQFNAIQNILGSSGAGRSTAATVLAPYAVEKQSSARFSDVEQKFQRNQGALDVAHEDEERQTDQYKNDLIDQRFEKRQALKSGLASSEINLQDQIGQIELGKQQLIGGDAEKALASLEPRRSRISELLDKIDNFGKLYKDAIASPGEISFDAPDLQQYDYSQFDSPFLNGGGSAARYSPLAALLSRREEEERIT